MDRKVIRDVTLRARHLLAGAIRDLPEGRTAPDESVRRAVLRHLIRPVASRLLEVRGLRGDTADGPDADVVPDPAGFGESQGCDSRLRPRPEARQQLRAMLSDASLDEAWAPGNEETIGWVYQYFNEPDLGVFHSQSPPKVPAPLVAAKTQLFTPRWIVKFLVQNTLGRLWVQMHPDSRLGESLEYLVPRVDTNHSVSVRPVREITILDPACGTMHFGLGVFDLLAEMYREELDRAGRPGWPKPASVDRVEDIPAAILTRNLFGADIDPVAVSLARLVLHIKARTMSPEADIGTCNIHCADVLGLKAPGLDRIPKPMWDWLPAGRSSGSWDAVLLKSASQGREAASHVINRCYDVVVTNPPYLDSRDYNRDLKSFIPSAYPAGKRNLYGAFLERCLGLVGESGRIGMVTPQTFMFISSFRKLRALLRDEVVIETLVQTGLNTFPEAVVDAAFYVLRRCSDAAVRERSVGTYFRLVKEPNAEAKRAAFERALTLLRRSEDPPASPSPNPRGTGVSPVDWEDRGIGSVVYRVRQADLDALPGRPWVYWAAPGLPRLFAALPRFREVARPAVGLQTSDNFRFLRFWWEVFARRPGSEDAGVQDNLTIAFGVTDRAAALATGRKWFPHMKGGSFRRWYGNQEYVVNWSRDGAEVRTLGLESGKVASRPQNTGFYFRPGVTWTHTSSRGLSVRILPAGFICNVEGIAAFQNGTAGSTYETLGLLNSAFARYTIDLLNPTVHFGGREVEDLPYPLGDAPVIERVEALVREAIGLARADSEEDETTWDFVAPPAWETGSADVARRHERLADVERRIDAEVYHLYGLGDGDRAVMEAELASTPVPEGVAARRRDRVPTARDELASRWISYAVGVVMGRFRPGAEGLGCGRFSADEVAALRALRAASGIAPLDPDHEDDLASKTGTALQLMLGPERSAAVVRTALGDADDAATLLRRYLERRFFAEHIRRYRKRPIYWLLQSPGRRYSVYLYYERITRDTLAVLRSDRYLGGKLARAGADGADLAALDAAIERVLGLWDERGRVVGWEPAIDDGVMLNLAPLHELMPAWPTEPARYWRRLAGGDYDWSRTARRYWPDRVLAKCRRVKSIALAHGRLDTCEQARSMSAKGEV